MLLNVPSVAIDWANPWPYPWSRLEELAWKAGIEPDELRDYLEREVARRQAQVLPPEVAVTAVNGSGAEP
jgi:hypothetical protein